MRGTQGVTDIADDITLASRGIPYDQVRDMVNWWLQVTTPSTSQARQIVWDPFRIDPGNPMQVVPGFVDAPTVAGTELAVGLGSIQGVNGHSLGGYLATAFTRLFGGPLGYNVQSVNTFNSAGFSNLMTSNTDGEFLNIAGLIGASKGLGNWNAVEEKQTNYYADNGWSVTTNAWGEMGFTALSALGGKATITLATSSLSTTAKTDFAAFLSLNALSPVVISTTGAAAIAALRAANPELASVWTADKNARLFGDTTRDHDYSDNWYADRAAMLATLVEANNCRVIAGGCSDYAQGGSGDAQIDRIGGNDALEGGDGNHRFNSGARARHSCREKHERQSSINSGCSFTCCKRRSASGRVACIPQWLLEAAGSEGVE